jgi:hypothetical protein
MPVQVNKKIISAFTVFFLLAGYSSQAQDGIAHSAPPVANVVSFNGLSEEHDNNIYWTSVVENNCSYFALERSCDYVMWEEAVKLKGEGNSTQQIPYYYHDEAPYTGFTYYRLKAVAADGNVTYSPSIVVESKMQIAVDIFPNPANGIIKVTVLGKENETSHLYIKSMMGQVVFYSDVMNNSAMEIDIESYPEGIYSVEVESRSGSTVERLVKR